MIGTVSPAFLHGGFYATQNSLEPKNALKIENDAKNTSQAALQKSDEKKAEGIRADAGCKTCSSRKYKDGSDDPGVSFKSATAIKPESAGAVVMAHEQEHVTREKQRAGQEGREVVAQSVTLHMGICAECKRPYVAGGTTRTTTAAVKNAYQNSKQNDAPSAINQKV